MTTMVESSRRGCCCCCPLHGQLCCRRPLTQSVTYSHSFMSERVYVHIVCACGRGAIAEAVAFFHLLLSLSHSHTQNNNKQTNSTVHTLRSVTRALAATYRLLFVVSLLSSRSKSAE